MAGLWDPKRLLLPSPFGDPGTITWDDKKEGFGWRKYRGGGSTVCTHAAGLPGVVEEYADRVLRNLAKIASSPEGARKFVAANAKLGSFDKMCGFEPPLLLEQAVAARLQFGEDVTRVVLDALRGLDGDDGELSDGEFLGRLQVRGRNYQKNCAICLAEDVAGTTCGHTEIVVFRPCGHSLCVQPCFERLVAKTRRVRMAERTTVETADGRKFAMQAHDVGSARGFPCPLCRGVVEKCFRAENVGLADSGIRDRLRAYAAGFSFDAIPERHLTAARRMATEEHAKAAAAARRFQDEEDARRAELEPLVASLVRESLVESKERRSRRRAFQNAGRWHWGSLERSRQKGFRDGWSGYHLLRRFHEPEHFRAFYADTAAWTCCGAAPHEVGCQPCPHLGYRCQCGDGAPAPIPKLHNGSDPTSALREQDIAGIYSHVLATPSQNEFQKKRTLKKRKQRVLM